MPRISLSLVCVSVSLLMNTPASADWQYARWGMTKTQLIAASRGEAVTAPAGKSCIKTAEKPMAMVAAKKIDRWTFEVIFCSNGDGHLSAIALEPTPAEGSYNGLRQALISRYGKPIEEHRGDVGVTMWRDAKAGNLILLQQVITMGRMEYQAISKGF